MFMVLPINMALDAIALREWEKSQDIAEIVKVGW